MSHELLFGINSVDAALSHDPGNIVELFIETGTTNARLKELSERARDLGVKPHGRTRELLDRMTGGARHQGVVAQYRAAPPRTEADLKALVEAAGQGALVVVLDGVTDPHNLGACLRSAEAAGATAVVVTKDKAVGITPIVRRASAGAADRVPFIAATNLARTLRSLKDMGVWLVGLAGDVDADFYGVDLAGPIALVIGSEGEGLRRLTREQCDFLVRIPMRGSVESLNVSVATGVTLFEALRQRAARKP
ncbi:23S rRNA (guanosine(2251)-2'-O)-methyltransferase RlmB [Tahibacter soli]|jgi:23S rRNA (guanosine2251-2'-O)-methyltransferase|uniref:23S rRNA (guanosine-2'-O-)-methyltransferase RlmB n=1 Tax=Tahibacter soli TaxID=2983605 RepID=A0A9X3YII8_9GAMM|nr:23S rRNA (guanosine(2251)-2'-O)-methyltransferase RlmB [Tahibacter soli]MDC8012124.1 23S rRNA (guanosine(2251)-2'-O)-methyltransferase RlmB [Tahibacter soli]